jgi:hypothetical protein
MEGGADEENGGTHTLGHGFIITTKRSSRLRQGSTLSMYFCELVDLYPSSPYISDNTFTHTVTGCH